MRTFYKILFFMGLSVIPFAIYAQDQVFKLADLKGKDWYMLGLTDKTSIAHYEDSIIIYTLIDKSKSLYKFNFEYYLSDSIECVFDASKVGKSPKGHFIISRVLKNAKSDPNQPQPVSIFQIIELNSTNLKIRNIEQKNFIEYYTK
jgi:hypothetical protein